MDDFNDKPETHRDYNIDISLQSHRNNLQPFYDMTHFFLGTILQPKTIDSLAETIDIGDSNTFVESFNSYTSEWVLYLLGYVILVSIGIICAFAVPIAGICFLSCRCCCRKCCIIKDPHDAKGAKCKRVCFGSLLAFSAVIVMFLSILSSMASVDFWVETKEEDGAIDQADEYLGYFEAYINNTGYELDTLVRSPFLEAEETIYYTLDNLGLVTTNTLGNITGVNGLLNRLTFFAYHLDELSVTLQLSETLRTSLISNSSDLDQLLANLKSDIISSADLCSFEQECTVSKQMAQDLIITPDYSAISDFSLAINSIQLLVELNTESKVNESVSNYIHIADIVNTTWALPIIMTKLEVEQIMTDISQYIDDFEQYLKQVDISNVTEDIDEAKSDIETSGDVWFFLSISSCLLLLLISIIYLTGEMTTVCLNLPSFEKDSCTTLITARIFLAGAGLTFLFTWIYFIFTTGMLVLGGLSYTEVCRHALDIDNSPAIEVLSQLISASFDSNANISLKTLLNNCNNDEALYTALELEENGFNVTAALDLNQYPLDGLLQNFKDIHVDLGNVVLLTKELNDSLLVGSAGLDSIDAKSAESILSQNITSVNLLSLAEQLNKTADALNIPSLTTSFRNYATLSESYYYSYIELMDQNRSNMSQNIEHIDYVTSETSISQLVTDLTYAQDWINFNGSVMVDDIVYLSVENLYVMLEELVDIIENAVRYGIGQCQPVYESYNGLVDIICINTLDPFNLVWFTQGLALILLMPCLFCAIKLSNMYRKTIRRNSIGDVPLNNNNNASDGISPVQATTHICAANGETSAKTNNDREHRCQTPIQVIQMNDLTSAPHSKTKEPNNNEVDDDEDDAVSIASDTSSVSEYMFMSLPKQPLITARPSSSSSKASRSKAPPPPSRHNKEELVQYLDMFA